MNHKELKWSTRDGIPIYGQSWATEQNSAKATICIVHGFGEHSGRYQYVAQKYNDAGYNVIAFDHRGHGKSGGQRGHTPSYDFLLDDVDILLEQAELNFPNTKKIIHAHSMGGNIAANYLIARDTVAEGAIMSAPFFKTTNPPPKFQLWLGRLMIKIWGAFPDRAKLDATTISRDKSVVDKYVNDPLVHNKISARMGISLLDYGLSAVENAGKITKPVLVMHGDADGLTEFAQSEIFAKRAGDSATFVNCKGLYHEIHNEPEKEEILKQMIDWCDQLV